MRKSSTPRESQADLGQRLRTYRLTRAIRQADLAANAGVSIRAVQSIESGAGSTVETLIRVLRALGLDDAIESIAATPSVSPIALLQRSNKVPQRVGRARRRT